MLLVLSLAVLALAPLLARSVRARPEFLPALDAFIVVSIGGLVFLEILPESVRVAGFPALVAALVGLVGPGVAERYLRRAAIRAHFVTLMLALVGLMLHASVDGAALSTSGSGGTSSLAVAIVLHRLPVALALWSLVRPSFGPAAGWGVLGCVGAATLVGYSFGSDVTATLGNVAVRTFEAFVAGSLIHVIFHAPTLDERVGREPKRTRGLEGVGSVVGLVTVAVLTFAHAGGHDHGHAHYPGIFPAFLSLALAIAPALYVAYFIAALVRAIEPRSLASIRSSGSFADALQGIILGVRAPVCTECNLPLVQNCIRVGMPASAVLAILIAAPGLSLDALLVAVPLFGAEFALLKVTGTVVVALAVGGLLGGLIARRSRDESATIELPESDDVETTEDPLVMARRQFVQVVDRTAPWILFGTGIAAVALQVVDESWFATLGALQIPIFALMGVIVNLGPAGAMPLLVVLLAKGASVGAVMAFGLASPVAGVATIVCLAERYGAACVAGFLALVIVIAVGVGFAADVVLQDVAPGLDEEGLRLGASPSVEATGSPGDSADHAGHDHAENDGHDHAGHDHAEDEGHDHAGHGHAEGDGHDHAGHDHADDPASDDEDTHAGHDHGESAGTQIAAVWGRAGWVDRACLVLVAALMLSSFLRRGARRFFGQVFLTDEEGEGHDHDHDHGVDCATPNRGGNS